jgi:protein-tyrosine phosphatase
MATDPSAFRLDRFLRNAAIIAAVIGACTALWFEVLRDRIVAKRFGEVTAHVHRSGQISEHVIGRVLAEHDIQRIVDLTEAAYQPAGKREERRIAAESGIEIVEFPLVGDGTGDVEVYARAVAMLIESDRDGVSTLVHCAAGTQRTGGVVAAFRILHHGWSVDEALREAQRYGWERDEVAMSNYLIAHLDEIGRRLVAWEIIDSGALADASRR